MPKLIKTSKPVLFAIGITEIAKKYGANIMNLCIDTDFIGKVEISYSINIEPENFESIDTFKMPKKPVFKEEYSLLIQSSENNILIHCINKIIGKNNTKDVSVKKEQGEVVLISNNIENIFLILDTLLYFITGEYLCQGESVENEIMSYKLTQ